MTSAQQNLDQKSGERRWSNDSGVDHAFVILQGGKVRSEPHTSNFLCNVQMEININMSSGVFVRVIVAEFPNIIEIMMKVLRQYLFTPDNSLWYIFGRSSLLRGNFNFQKQEILDACHRSSLIYFMST